MCSSAHLDIGGVAELDHIEAAVGEVDLEGGLVGLRPAGLQEVAGHPHAGDPGGAGRGRWLPGRLRLLRPAVRCQANTGDTRDSGDKG